LYYFKDVLKFVSICNLWVIFPIAESTQSVDGGPASWRLTLDQDLIDTLKGNFPSWFQGSAGGGGAASKQHPHQHPQQQHNHQQAQQKHHQLVATSVIPITIFQKSLATPDSRAAISIIFQDQ